MLLAISILVSIKYISGFRLLLVSNTMLLLLPSDAAAVARAHRAIVGGLEYRKLKQHYYYF